jgi:hypothetical protein
MAVAIKFNNVVARQAAVAAKLAGVLPPAAPDLPLSPLADAHLLIWPALMDAVSPQRIARGLQAAGLRHGYDDHADFAVVTPGFPESYPAWLEVGHVGTRRACWLKGTDPGALIDWRDRP